MKKIHLLLVLLLTFCNIQAQENILDTDYSQYLNKKVEYCDHVFGTFVSKGKKKVILIRSQSGKPIATFAGDKVVFKETEIEKSTSLIIDGKLLFIYRSDYSIYDSDLLLDAKKK